MARIDINEPYEDYLKKQVDAGLFRSITAAAEHAIYQQMIEHEKLKILSIQNLLEKGEAEIKNGKTIKYTSSLISEISMKGKAASLSNLPVKDVVKP